MQKISKFNKKKKSPGKHKKNNFKPAVPKGQVLMLQMIKTIQQFFPDLPERIQASVPDPRATSVYSMVEIIMAGVAMFLFKEGSRNAMNQSREEGYFKNNYRALFNCELPHLDTVDEVLRVLDETALKKLSKTLIKSLLTNKVLHKFRVFKKYFIVAIDATGVHSFDHQHCQQCLTRTSKNGKITYFHHVLEAKLIAHNGFSLSLGTEWIENTETGYDKQDCELKAFKRLAEQLKKDYPRLPICITADGLYPNTTFFKVCENNSWLFISAFKDGNLPSVQEKITQLISLNKNNHDQESVTTVNYQLTKEYDWLTDIEYGKHSLNWAACIETKTKEGEEPEVTRFVYVTNINISEKNIKEIIHTGRLRQKIENEGFNTQKNLGYKLEHKYSRTSFRATKNYYQCLQIAHIINQLMELSAFVKCQLKDWNNTLKHSWKCIWSWMVASQLDVTELNTKLSQRIQYRY